MGKKACKKSSIEAVLTVGNKGQVLLPKELREKAEIKPGDKLALIARYEDNGKICCFILIKNEQLDKSVKEAIGPMLKGAFS